MKSVRLILVVAPSGAGKNSFMSQALKEFSQLEDIITYTTRDKRVGEEPTNPYHFISRQDFEARIKNGFFAEWSTVHDALYGTSCQSLEDAWKRNQVAILDIDVQGAEKLSRIYKDAVSIFIVPPSIKELKRRILARDKIAPANLELRLANAKREIQTAYKHDYQVINDDFEESYGRFRQILEGLLA